LQRSLDSKKKEVTHLQRQLKEFQPQLDEATASLNNIRAKMEELEAVVSEAEDEIFSEFTTRLNYPNIREYEKRQGSLQQESAQKKLEFTTQISKLENQLAFETQRLKQTTERIGNLEKNAERDRITVEELEAEKAQIQEQMDVVMAEVEVLREELGARRAELETRNEKVNGLRREVSKRSKDVEDTTKLISGLEGEIERNAAGRYAILRRCKLEEIEIPLAEESAPLDNLPIDDALQTDPDAMDVDEDEDPSSSAVQKIQIQDYGIEVDFDDLDDDLKEVRISTDYHSPKMD